MCCAYIHIYVYKYVHAHATRNARDAQRTLRATPDSFAKSDAEELTDAVTKEPTRLEVPLPLSPPGPLPLSEPDDSLATTTVWRLPLLLQPLPLLLPWRPPSAPSARRLSAEEKAAARAAIWCVYTGGVDRERGRGSASRSSREAKQGHKR